MNSQNELIEEYLSGRLSGKELTQVKERIATDSTFASEVDEHKSVQELIHLRGLIDTKQKLDAIRLRKEAEASKWKKIKWFGGAGVIALLAISSLILNSINQNNKPIGITTTSTNQTKPIVTSDSNLSKVTDSSNSNSPVTSGKSKGSGIFNNNQVVTSDVEIKKDSALVPTLSSSDLSNRLLGKGINENGIKKDSLKKNAGANVPDPCANVLLTSDVKIENSCIGLPNGKLLINNVQGGKSPYLFTVQSLTSSTYYQGTTINYFDNMEAGSYKIIITDANNCTTEVLTDIKTKYCETAKKGIFAPDLGEVWIYPVKPSTNGTVRIYDSTGILVYEVIVKNNYPSSWDGRGREGSELKAGGYVYQILYEDGTYEQGSVTIAR